MDFLGVIIGGVLVIVANAVSQILKARADRELDSAKRADDRLLGHEQFQRETLVKLQDAAYDLLVATTRVYSIHKRRAEDGAGWGGPVPTEVDDEGVRALVAVQLMRVRIADDQLRAITKRLTDLCGTIIGAQSPEAADQGMALISEVERDLETRSGELLRATFRGAALNAK